MNATGFLFGIIIVGILGLVFYSFISDGLSSFARDQADVQEAGKLYPNPQVGETICDLKLIIKGTLDHKLFSLPTVLVWHLNENSLQSTWLSDSCFKTGTASFLSLLPQPYFEKLDDYSFKSSSTKLSYIDGKQELDLIGIGDTEYEIEIKLVDVNGKVIDSKTFPNLKKKIFLPSGTIPEPYAWDKTFLLDNIPRRDYTVEVYMIGEIINNLDAGEAYKLQVGK